MSTFSNLQPLVLGVTVNVFGSNNTMNLSNYSGKNIVVLGRAGEPYLRFTPGGVQENMRSPTTYLNHSQPVPAAAGSAVMPKWRKVSNGTGYAWHDHRIVLDGQQPTPGRHRRLRTYRTSSSAGRSLRRPTGSGS